MEKMKAGTLAKYSILLISIAIVTVSFPYTRYLPTYIFMGIVDGLNICSLSLMTLFISLMYSANVERKMTLFLGLAYISSVFISYFLVGFGILLSISLPAVPHFFTKVSVALMISVGTLNILNYFRPGLISLDFATSLGRKATQYMKAVTLPSLVVAGILVGLHHFPCACTGGIYLTFISLVANARLKMAYLALYNFLFVLPLIAILYVCSSKPVTVRFRKQYLENTKRMKLILGTVMILLSLLIATVIS